MRACSRWSSDFAATSACMSTFIHWLVTDGAFNEQGAEVRFLPAPVPTPERMTAVLAQVHKATASGAENDDQGLDPALATCGAARARRPAPGTARAGGKASADRVGLRLPPETS